MSLLFSSAAAFAFIAALAVLFGCRSGPRQTWLIIGPTQIVEGDEARFEILDLPKRTGEWREGKLIWSVEPSEAAWIERSDQVPSHLPAMKVQLHTNEVDYDTSVTVTCVLQEGDRQKWISEFPLNILNIPAGWRYETIAQDTSHGCSMQLDSMGRPVIAYRDMVADRATKRTNVSYTRRSVAYWDGSVWQTSAPCPVERWTNILTLDQHDNPCLPCTGPSSQGYAPQCLTWDGEAWDTTTIDPGARSSFIRFAYAGGKATLYTVYHIGDDRTQLGFAANSSAKWRSSRIAMPEELRGSKIVYGSSIQPELKANSEAGTLPHVLVSADLYGHESEAIMLHFTPANGDWGFKVIQGLEGGSCAVDNTERLHWLYKANGGEAGYGIWDGIELESYPLPDSYSAAASGIALDGEQRPHFLYTTHMDGHWELVHCVRKNSQWISTVIELLGTTQCSLAVGADGYVHVAAIDSRPHKQLLPAGEYHDGPGEPLSLKYVSFPCP